MSWLKKWKYTRKIKKLNKNNVIVAPFLKNFKIFVSGTGNVIQIDDDITELRGKLSVWGNNNKIVIKKGHFCNINVSVGIDTNRTTSGSVLIWNENIYCGSANIVIGEDNSEVVVGQDCLISSGIDMYCTDGHSIVDVENRVLNIGRFIHIGEHVWIGKDVKIGKNTTVPSNSVIGWGSVVTRQFTQKNVVIGGNPAKIIKENVHWERDFPNLKVKNGCF